MNTSTNLKWAIYARKSSESEDRQIQSIPDQINYLKEVANRDVLRIQKTLSEAKSAKAPYAREGFKALISLIDKGEIDAILCWKLDRLSRNPIDSGTLQWLLQSGKIKCIKTSDRVYRSDDNSLVFAVEQGMDNQYVRDLSKNVKRGLHAKAEKGWFPNIPPVGYLNSKYREKGNEKILVDKRRFNLVRKMFDLVLTGNYSPQSALRIATEVWNLDIPVHRKRAGKKIIGASSIYPILSNIFYTGYFKYAGKVYKGNHQPMLSFKEFEDLQQIIKKKDHSRPYTHSFPFTGVMKCAKCGGSITASEKLKLVRSTGEKKAYTYYHCSRRVVGHTNCSNLSVPQKEFETLIEGYLEKLTIGEHYFKLGMEVLRANEGQEEKLKEDVLKKQISHVSEIERKIERLLPLLLNETITEDEYKTQKSELEKILTVAKGRLTQIDDEVISYTKHVENAFIFSRYALDALKNADLQTRKNILISIGSNHRLIDKNLYVDTFGWHSTIKEGEKIISSHNGRLELQRINKDNSLLEKSKIFLSVCGVIENVKRVMSKTTNPFIVDLSEWVKHFKEQEIIKKNREQPP